MKKICLYFQVHQPFRLHNYRFFDIGKHYDYFDEAKNRGILRKVADRCYLPANNTLLQLIQEYGTDFRVSFSLSGTVLDQFARYTPEVLESFQQLAATGSVEILGETYAHSLASLSSPREFTEQVLTHRKEIERLFNQQPQVFRNTELIYSDEIGQMVHQMGFKAMLAEGADHILGWKSPNFLYYNPLSPELKLLLKNYRLSDDIAFRFSESTWNNWPLTAEKFVSWLRAVPEEEEVINLFMDYETFGEHQWRDSGIFEFLKVFPGQALSQHEFEFITPSQAVEQLKPVGLLSMPNPVSWADAERDLSAWLGNQIQDDAFESLYRLENKVKQIADPQLLQEWRYLQTSDHFYYMCTKFFADGDVHKYFNPYGSPFEAFINYMNVLGDFEDRLNTWLHLTHQQALSSPGIQVPELLRQ